MSKCMSVLIATGVIAVTGSVFSAHAQNVEGKSAVTFGGGVPSGSDPGRAFPTRPAPRVGKGPGTTFGKGPGTTGKSGIIFKGGVPGGSAPGKTTPSKPVSP